MMHAPGSTLGILGGGQLGRMLAMALAELGYRAHIYTDEADCPAAQVTPHVTIGAYDDAAALARFAESVDAVTYEFENIPLAAAQAVVRAGKAVHPSPHVLATCQHRSREKAMLSNLGIPIAPYADIATEADLATAAIPFPAILKTAESGYDGKGQAKVDSAKALAQAWAQFGRVPCVLEAMVDFSREIAVTVARGADGQMACYDAVETIQRHHRLDEALVPAPITPVLAAEAQSLARRIAEALDVRGLLAVEMFLTTDGALLVNELAPRPHNSAHWTTDACETGQFAQCARAVLGLPLGSPSRHSDARMKNLIGEEAHAWAEYLADPHARLHLYGKRDARPGRKMGHVTWLKPRS